MLKDTSLTAYLHSHNLGDRVYHHWDYASVLRAKGLSYRVDTRTNVILEH